MTVGQNNSDDGQVKNFREGQSGQDTCDRGLLKQFLDLIWDIEGYRVVGVQLTSKEWKWLAVNSAEEVEEVITKYPNANIYYGVNPRTRYTGKKGSDEDIDRADNLFVDLDFKEETPCTPSVRVDEPNGRLNLCYRDEGKTYEVDRPALNTILNKVKERGLPEPTVVVDSGNGYHLIWKLKEPLPREDWKGLEAKVVEALADLNADPQAKDISRILRLPCSVNQRSKRRVRILYINNRRYTADDFSSLDSRVQGAGSREGSADSVKELKLSEQQVKELVSSLAECFKRAEDRRFEFTGHLSGGLCRRGIPLEQAEAILESLYDLAGLNPEHVKDVKYTYRDCQAGKPVTGLNSLVALCSELGVQLKLPEWLAGASPTRETKDIATMRTLFAPHDFVDGKPYVTIYSVETVEEVSNGKSKEVERLVPHVFTVDENGNIVELTREQKSELSKKYIITHIANTPRAYILNVVEPDVNMPSRLDNNVKVSEVFREVVQFLKDRLTLASEEDYVVTAVWIIASYFFPVFSEFPYLAPYKESFGSGGTEFLKALWKLLPRAMLINMPTPASVYNIVSNLRGALLIDEIDERKTTEETMRLIWNLLVSCFHKKATIPRVKLDNVVYYKCYSPKAVIDQRLVFSHTDIASRTVFVKLKYDPDRDPDDWETKPRELVDKLFSVFLKYSRRVDELYRDKNFDVGYHGREGQTLRPLVVIATLIDEEDSSLEVTVKLRKGLRRTVEYHAVVKDIGDPKRRLELAIREFIASSLKEVARNYERGLGFSVPEPWHVKRTNDRVIVYIYTRELVKEVKMRLMSPFQRDISIRPNPEGKEVMNLREWERLDDEVADLLKDRTFVAFLKHHFGEHVVKFRDRTALAFSMDEVVKIVKEVTESEEEIEEVVDKLGEQQNESGDNGTAGGDGTSGANPETKEEKADNGTGGNGSTVVLDEDDLLKLRILEELINNKVNGQHGVMTWKKFREKFNLSDRVKGLVDDMMKKGFINSDGELLWITPDGYIELDNLKKLVGQNLNVSESRKV